uniref:Uncharacterized protein n=1 Tax=Salix viminalis TaxID=40686 RepID=A0A6N2KHN0_SALVM
MMVVSLQVWLPLCCVEEERTALLQLKDSLNYPNGTSLPSWIKGDACCCDWELVRCSSTAGRVTKLYLSGVRNGEPGDWYLNASLFLPFQELNTLFLWGNQIAECPGNLETLELSSNNITKVVASGGPTNLSALYVNNITAYGSSFQTLLQPLEAFPNLTTLGLGDNDLRGRILGDDLLNLSSLEELNLDVCSLDENSLQSLGALSSLKNLSLPGLSGAVPFQGFLNLKNLELLDLSDNTLNSNSIIQTIGTMTSLKTLTLQFKWSITYLPSFLNLKNFELLDMSGSTLNSSNIFQTIGTMTSLKTLMLEGCSLNGQLPTGLCDLNHLRVLDISSNDLSGFLPPCLTNLTSLQYLYLFSNHLKIPMSLSPLYNLSKLKDFYGSDNEIYAEEDDHNLSPKFQLQSLYLSGHGQENNTYLESLYLENCSLLGPFLLPRSSHVNLSILSISMNDFQGQIPAEIGAYFPGLQGLIMSDNGFDGIIPSSLDLSDNGFDGSIPSSLGSLSSLKLLDLSNNFLTGRILSNNSLQGHIPGWIRNMSSLEFLDIKEQPLWSFTTKIGASSKLRYVYLSRNKLQGPITMEFDDSSMILALDLSHNNLSGRIPEWIGGLSNLRFLLLSHNNLEGGIPIQLCKLEQLTIIDLSHNYLSGNILSWTISTHPFPNQDNYNYQQSFEFTMKNVLLIYKGSIIHYFTGIDFSCNNFTGKIPPEIGNLSNIKVLNLSHNSLTRPIPPTFSRLKEIESLDLSFNKLEGEIPPQLTGLYSLAAFNVAHNNLSGKTPARVAQFATFDESCYKDNTFLCGELLPKACGLDMPPTPTSTNNEDNSGFMDM